MPSRTASLLFRRAFSTTQLPEDVAVISMDCKIGTPAALRVARVRAKRARVAFFTTSPILAGILRTARPHTFLPRSDFFHRKNRYTPSPIAAYTSTPQKLVRILEMSMQTRVGSG